MITIVVPAGQTADVAISPFELPAGRDFLFDPNCNLSLGPTGGVSSMLVSSNLSTVEIFNSSEADVKVPRNYLLGNVVDFTRGLESCQRRQRCVGRRDCACQQQANSNQNAEASLHD